MNESEPTLHAKHTSNETKTLKVWLIKDGKKGHENQLEGLLSRLEAHRSLEAQVFTPKMLHKGKPKNAEDLLFIPNIVMGAGHATHRSLLKVAKTYQAFSVVLMKPSLPLKLFDTVICPRHDGLKESTRVLNTLGAVNKLPPPGLETLKKKSGGTILIGGPSKHYQWNSEKLIDQIHSLCEKELSTPWTLYDSPRTPADFHGLLEQSMPDNLSLMPTADATTEDLQKALLASATCWVSPDSVSMLYEALTAGCDTAIFNLKANSSRRKSRILKGLEYLISKQAIGTWSQWQKDTRVPNNVLGLWEADRAACWLLERYEEALKTTESHD